MANKPPDKPILKTQANEVFSILSEVGLDVSEFEWQMTESAWAHNGLVSQLVHPPTGFYYRFDLSDQGHWAEYSPGQEKPIEVKHPGSWALQRHEVQNWARAVKRELDAPDLWGAIVAGKQLVEGPSGSAADNQPFTRPEQQRLEASLREIREYAAQTLAPTADQLRIIDERLAYLEEASTRLGRKDWLILAAGTLTNIIVAGAFAPRAAQELFRFAGQALNWLLGNAPLLP